MAFHVETSAFVPFPVQDVISTGDAYEVLPGGALEITRLGKRVIIIESSHWFWVRETGTT